MMLLEGGGWASMTALGRFLGAPLSFAGKKEENVECRRPRALGGDEALSFS